MFYDLLLFILQFVTVGYSLLWSIEIKTSTIIKIKYIAWINIAFQFIKGFKNRTNLHMNITVKFIETLKNILSDKENCNIGFKKEITTDVSVRHWGKYIQIHFNFNIILASHPLFARGEVKRINPNFYKYRRILCVKIACLKHYLYFPE